MKLFTLSGTAYTPTHIVNYGGTPGGIRVDHLDVPNSPKYVLGVV